MLLPFDGHQPVSPRDLARDELRLVAMFRRPSQRLISAYLDNYHAHGLPRRERLTLKAQAPTIALFARYPGIAGCTAKMLAGYHCASRVVSLEAVVRTAIAVLRSPRFAFVGLVEEWVTSICLLHRMLPGHTAPMAAEFRRLGHSQNANRAISWLPKSDADGVYNESVLEGFIDDADERVYEAAVAVFKHHLRAHHAPGCAAAGEART